MGFYRFFLLMCVVVLTAGCSGAPDRAEVQRLLETKLKSELDNHHETRNAFGSLVSGRFGGVPASVNPTSESLSIEKLEILDEKVQQTLFGSELLVYTVQVDASYSVGGSSKSETGKEGMVALVETNEGWKVSHVVFSNFLGFRQLN